MPEERTCDYTGQPIEPGTGIMYVAADGSILHFVDSKAEKNYFMGREARDLPWTEDAREEAEARAPEAVEEPVVSEGTDTAPESGQPQSATGAQDPDEAAEEADTPGPDEETPATETEPAVTEEEEPADESTEERAEDEEPEVEDESAGDDEGQPDAESEPDEDTEADESEEAEPNEAS